MKLDASAFVLVSLLTACGTSSNDGEHLAEVRSGESAPSAALGTWRFDLDASDVAVAIREKCAKETDPKACWTGIAAEAKLEKVRLSEESGQAMWTSFAADPKGEIVFVKVPVEVVADGPGHLLAKVAGPATGVHADGFNEAKVSQLRIELVDENTLAMDDPKKGRLVFAKE